MVPGEGFRFDRQLRTTPEEDEVLAAEREWLVAHTTGDVALLDRLMGDEYQLAATDGSLLAKWDVLRSFATGRRWDLARSYIDAVQIYGDTAVVFGRYWARSADQTIDIDVASRYMAVWVRRGARWQIVADQATPIADAR